jgi:hypothetical protein
VLRLGYQLPQPSARHVVNVEQVHVGIAMAYR